VPHGCEREDEDSQMKSYSPIVFFLLPMALALVSCSKGRSPIFVTSSGNCRILLGSDSNEYNQYIAGARRAAGCQRQKLLDCPAQIKLELVDFPARIPRDRFESPDFANHDYARVRLRTTSLVDYDLWLSQYFSPDLPWLHGGYVVRYRDRADAGAILRPTVSLSMLGMTDCSKYVVLSARNSVDLDIPLAGKLLTKLEGNECSFRVAYAVNPAGSPMAVRGTVPILGFAVSNKITIVVE
jgi:hypothetical protein